MELQNRFPTTPTRFGFFMLIFRHFNPSDYFFIENDVYNWKIRLTKIHLSRKNTLNFTEKMSIRAFLDF